MTLSVAVFPDESVARAEIVFESSCKVTVPDHDVVPGRDPIRSVQAQLDLLARNLELRVPALSGAETHAQVLVRLGVNGL